MPINSSRIKVGAFVSGLVMVLTAAVLPLSLSWVHSAQANRQQVEDRLVNVRRVLELLVDAETGQRGYVITGKEDFLQPYHAALAALPGELQSMVRRYEDEGIERQDLIQELLRNTRLRLNGLAEIVRLRQDGGFAAAEPIISSGQGKHYMDEVRRIAAQLGGIESQQLADREHDLQTKSWFAIAFSLGSTLLTVALLGYIGTVMMRAVRLAASSEDAARRTSRELEAGMETLKRLNSEMSILSEMSNVLQTEMTLVEALQVAGLFCQRLLPNTDGAIYLQQPSAELLELSSRWGDGQAAVEPLLETSACWGLRRGQCHSCSAATDLRCAHSPAAGGGFELCLPLIAYGEVLGLLNVRGKSVAEMEATMSMAQSISEQVALTMSNAKLRQVLRDQSVRDTLTGLFNRRWMEEFLQREMARARRSGKPISVVVADLDHFKRVNDTHGHPAGDAVLRAAAAHLGANLRVSDIACRYGGEEFVLILPDCDKEAAVKKARQLCDGLRALSIVENGQQIPVTASFGVAASPADGDQWDELFKSADRAVYAAKHAGRDRVVAATAMATAAVA